MPIPTTVTDLLMDARPTGFIDRWDSPPLLVAFGRLRISERALNVVSNDSAESLPVEAESLALVNGKPITVSEYRKLYWSVGGRWHWVDRIRMADVDLAAELSNANTQIFVLWDAQRIAGFFELFDLTGSVREIRYLGLTELFLGRGLGRRLLSSALRMAWQPGVREVRIETCDLDHPGALPLYQEAGFRILGTRIKLTAPLGELPNDPHPP